MLRKLIDKIPFVRHHFLTVMFVLGFVVDNLTLNQVDQTFDNLILALYVFLAMTGILTLYAGIAERMGERLKNIKDEAKARELKAAVEELCLKHPVPDSFV